MMLLPLLAITFKPELMTAGRFTFCCCRRGSFETDCVSDFG